MKSLKIFSMFILLFAGGNKLFAQNFAEPKGVDMGGTVLWSTCNFLMENPEEAGYVWGWGDPSGELQYQADDPDDENYIDAVTCSIMYGGLVPEPEISGTELDVVNRFLSNGWRLPKIDEFWELHDCKWELTQIGGILGYKVTADNGNSIFFPSWNEEIGEIEGLKSVYGAYWTGSACNYLPYMYTDDDQEIYGAFGFNLLLVPWWLKSEDYDLEFLDVADESEPQFVPRWWHLMIRPVKSKK